VSNVSTIRRYGPIWLLFLGFWLAFQMILRSQPLSDPGALWHVRVGDWVFEHGGFPRTDPFTWSYAGKQWAPQQWGGECLMSLIHRIGGFDALLMLMNAMLAGLAAWIGKRFIDGGLHPLPAAGIVALGMATAGFHFYLRPHLATIVLTAVFMASIVDFDRRRIDMNRLVWLIPLCVVWTNLHGGVLGGIAMLGIAAVGWLVFGKRGLKQTSLLALLAGACLLSTLINPFFLDMHRIWFGIVGSESMKQYVAEHQPLNLARTDGQAIAGFGCFYLLMLAGTLPRRPRITWLIPLAWLALSVTSIRHGPLFCVTALVALADLLPETVWFRLLKKYGDTFVMEPAASPAPIGWKGWAPILGMVLASACLIAAQMPVPLIGYDWARFDSKQVPIELEKTLQDYAKSKPDGFPIYNDANLGGFLIYFTPSLKIFMDDRFELYGEDGLRDYVEMIYHHPERIEDWAAKAPFDRALVERHDKRDEQTAMELYLADQKNGWSEVARCQKAVLYKRIR
jgi:hypothetical protein